MIALPLILKAVKTNLTPILIAVFIAIVATGAVSVHLSFQDLKNHNSQLTEQIITLTDENKAVKSDLAQAAKDLTDYKYDTQLTLSSLALYSRLDVEREKAKQEFNDVPKTDDAPLSDPNNMQYALRVRDRQQTLYEELRSVDARNDPER